MPELKPNCEGCSECKFSVTENEWWCSDMEKVIPDIKKIPIWCCLENAEVKDA